MVDFEYQLVVPWVQDLLDDEIEVVVSRVPLAMVLKGEK